MSKKLLTDVRTTQNYSSEPHKSLLKKPIHIDSTQLFLISSSCYAYYCHTFVINIPNVTTTKKYD